MPALCGRDARAPVGVSFHDAALATLQQSGSPGEYPPPHQPACRLGFCDSPSRGE